MEKAQTYQGNRAMRVAAVLLCMVLASMCLLSGLLARYAAYGSGADDARVASFLITGSGDVTRSFAVTLDPTTQGVSKAIEITNGSEVAVQYALTVENKTGNMPLTFTLKDSDGKEITDMTDSLLMGQSTTCSLYISWDSTQDNYSSFTYNREVDWLTVTLECKQID